MTDTNKEHWLGCKMIYEAATEEICYELQPDVEKMFHAYITRINSRPKHNVWYDEKVPKVFGCDENYLNSPVPNEAIFLDSKSGFIDNPKYGLPSAARYGDFVNPNNGFNVHSDGFFESIPEMKKYKDSTILIVGAGPSVRYVDWKDTERDFTWTCNHFYTNKEVSEEDIDLFYINAEVHMGIPELSEYVKKHNTICAADVSISRPEHILPSFKKEDCTTMLFGTRLFMTGGAAQRLVALAILAGAKKIAFVGIDGWTSEQIDSKQCGDHAFEYRKKLKISSNYNFDFQRRETVMFWDYYLNSLSRNVEFVNLSENYKDNMSAEISKKMFPLDV